MWIDLAFVFIGFVADNILRLMFPVDPSLRILTFVPNLGFLALLLVSLKKTFPSAVLTAFVLGLMLDLLHHEAFVYAVSYPISILLVKIWSQQLNDSLFEHVFMGIIGLFIKELVLYALLFLFAYTRLDIRVWFIRREFMTLVLHIPLLIGLALLDRTRVSLQKRIDKERLSRESIRWNPTARP